MSNEFYDIKEYHHNTEGLFNFLNDEHKFEQQFLDYNHAIKNGKIVAGELIQMAAERTLYDLEIRTGKDLIWNPKEAIRCCAFAHTLAHYTGGMEDDPETLMIKLIPWQINYYFHLLGFYRENRVEHGNSPLRNKYDQSWLEIGRKAPKSTTQAMYELYRMAYTEAKGKSYLGAPASHQAKNVHDIITSLIKHQPSQALNGIPKPKRDEEPLPDGIEPRDALVSYTTEEIRRGPKSNEIYDAILKYIAITVETCDGLNFKSLNMDEIHELTDGAAYSKLTTGMGGQRNKLLSHTTTAGQHKHKIAYEIRKDFVNALKSRSEEDPGDNRLSLIYCADEKDKNNYQDINVIRKANPGWDHSVTLREFVLRQMREVQGSAWNISNFRRMQLNLWDGTGNNWINLEKEIHHEYSEIIDIDGNPKGKGIQGFIEDFSDQDIWWSVGLDFAQVDDICGLVLAAHIPEKNHYYLWSKGFISNRVYDNNPLLERKLKNFVIAGELKHLNKSIVSIEDIIIEINKWRDIIGEDIYKVWVDNYRVEDVKRGLLNANYACDDVSWLPGNITPILGTFEATIEEGRLFTCGSELFTYCLSNVVKKESGHKLYSIQKESHNEKIDLVSAAIHALAERFINFNPYVNSIPRAYF